MVSRRPTSLNRAWIVIISGLMLTAVSAVMVDRALLPDLAFFSTLVFLTSFLTRIDRESVGFEAVVVLPIVVLFRDPWMAGFACFAGLATGAIVLAVIRRRISRFRLFYATQVTIGYMIGGALFVKVVERDAGLAVVVAGYVLLLVTFIVCGVTATIFVRKVIGLSGGGKLAIELALHSKTLVMMSPIVAVEILVHPHYGAMGFAVAFLPVLLVAFVIQSESRAEAQNAELAQRNLELALLSGGSLELFSAETAETVVSRLTRLLSKLEKMRASAVVLWNQDPERPDDVFRFGECRLSDEEILTLLSGSGYENSAPRRPVLFRALDVQVSLSGTRSRQLIGGIQTSEVIYGILIFDFEGEGRPDDERIDLFNLVLSQAALSLQDQFLKSEMHQKGQRLERQANTMRAISEVSSSLIGVLDAESVFAQISGALLRSAGVQTVVLAHHNARSGNFLIYGADAEEGDGLVPEVSRDFVERLLDARYALSSSFYYPHPEMTASVALALFGGASDIFERRLDTLLVPLTMAESCVGLIAVAIADGSEATVMDRVQTIEIFANQSVTALQSVQQYQEIKRLSILDPLTPAYNHRYFQETLQKEVHRHQRSGSQFSVALIDLDNFKSVNDTWGHQAGDEVLKGIVARILENVRDIDTVARYGGEEFAIVFPNLGREAAHDAAERLRERIAADRFSLGSEEGTLGMTSSFGVAVYPEDGSNGSALISSADTALYRAKRLGKNRVCMAGQKTSAAAEG